MYVSYYPDIAFPGAAEAIGSFARLAVTNGVRRLVLLSGRGEKEAQISEQLIFTEVLDGRNAHLTDGVRRAIGREPRDFTDFARDTAATGVWAG